MHTIEIKGAKIGETGPRAQFSTCPQGLAPDDSCALRGTQPAAAQPLRTCIGCRKRGARSTLLRLVLSSASTAEGQPRVLVDEGKCLPGRGAWLHGQVACLELAITRRAVARALRLGGTPPRGQERGRPADLMGEDLAQIRRYVASFQPGSVS